VTAYLDTSCLLKLLLLEPESEAVRQAIAGSDEVVVSSLTRLEAEVTLKSGYLGGRYRARQWGAYREKLGQLLVLAPFRMSGLGGGVFETAISQDRQAAKTHCRSLDRLHLAAMQELGLRRLMTHDEGQAVAALALGYRVDRPGRR
jgi:predicted nucleic acid-binding protein